MNDKKIKNFTQQLSIIEQFESYKNQKVIIENCDGDAFITKSKRKFKLSYDGVFNYKSDKKIKVQLENLDFTFQSIDFNETIDDRFAKIPAQHTFDIDKVYKGDFNKVALFRMFFFDNSKNSNIFHYKLEKAKQDGINTWAFNCVRLTVNKQNYDITQHKNNNNSYFVIENLESRDLKEFQKDAYAIQIGIGFLIGYMPGGENYIFCEDNFVYRRLSRKSLKSIYFPVTSNPYSKLHKEREIADSYYGKLKVIPTDVISDFVSQLRNNEDFSVAIIFLMEVTNLNSINIISHKFA